VNQVASDIDFPAVTVAGVTFDVHRFDVVGLDDCSSLPGCRRQWSPATAIRGSSI
jgi:hypothetical protein